MDENASVARVFILEDPCFGSARLSTIVRSAECEPFAPHADASLAATLDSLLPSPELIIVTICSGGEEILEAVRKRHWLHLVPILAISPADASGLDLWRLRGFGVVGLIDQRASADHVRFRVEEVIAARFGGPRDVRVPCCFLVDVEAQGSTTTEFALSFSIGGIGLASVRPIEPNTEVTLWLPLKGASERVGARGRVVRSRVRADGRHDVGVAFFPHAANTRDALTNELRMLLLAHGLQLGQMLQAASSGRSDDPREVTVAAS